MFDFMMTEKTAPWTVIILAAIVTYTLRVGGLLLSEWLPQKGPFRRFLDALPGTLLLSLVIPGLIAAGTAGFVAGAAVVGVTIKTRNAFFAMVVGTVIVAILRMQF